MIKTSMSSKRMHVGDAKKQPGRIHAGGCGACIGPAMIKNHEPWADAPPRRTGGE